jgi:hypothetical protein
MGFNYKVSFVCEKESLTPFLKKYSMIDHYCTIPIIGPNDEIYIYERFRSPMHTDFKDGCHSIVILKRPRDYRGQLFIVGIDETSCEKISDDFFKLTEACKCGKVSKEVL